MDLLSTLKDKLKAAGLIVKKEEQGKEGLHVYATDDFDSFSVHDFIIGKDNKLYYAGTNRDRQSPTPIGMDQIREISGTGGGAAGASQLSGTGEQYGTKYAFKKKKSAKLESILKEVSYKQKIQKRSKQEQVHKAIKEVKKRLQEASRMMEYANNLNKEVNESGESNRYARFNEQNLNKLKESVGSLYKKLKEFNNG